MQYPKWSEQELILLCDAMMSIGWKQIRPNNPLATELSTMLRYRALREHGDVGPRFRSPGSISRKSENIRTAPADYTGAKTRGGALDAVILQRFRDSPVEMHREAAALRGLYSPAGTVPEATAAPSRGIDSAFPAAYVPPGKVDSAVWSEIGAVGELALVGLLKEAAPELQVDHVADTHDGLGYDIAVSGRTEAHLEVKSTTRQGRLTIYLSRNEYHTLCRDPVWELVAVQLNAGREPMAVATVPSDWISDQVPVDRSSHGRWESCRLDVPPEVPVPGISSLDIPSSTGAASQLLSGVSEWVS